MSLTLPESATTRAGDRWIRIPATWGTYLRLLADRGERPRPRYIFLDGRLTIVSPGVPHESLRKRLSSLLELLLETLSIEATLAGSVTLLKSGDSREGTEADDAYYFTNLDVLEGKSWLVMGEDPPPDLVIEIVVSHPEHDALEAYRRFGVREVWVVRERGMAFLVLGDDGYRPTPTSVVLPFLGVDEFASWVVRKAERGDTRLRQEFRDWVRQTLAPRVQRKID